MSDPVMPSLEELVKVGAKVHAHDRLYDWQAYADDVRAILAAVLPMVLKPDQIANLMEAGDG